MRFFRPNRNWGLTLLGVWLIATALLYFIPGLTFPRSADLLAILALAAGVLILLGR
jgi:hypothetical protein